MPQRDRPEQRLDAGALRRCRRAADSREQRERARKDADRPGIRAQPVGHDAFLAQEPGALDGIAADAAPGDHEGRARALELAERQPHVAECLRSEHDGLGTGPAPLGAGCDGALEHRGCVDVGVDGPRLRTRQQAVAERLPPGAGLEEVVRQVGGDGRRVSVRALLERVRDPAVEHAPAAEREAVVGGVPQQSVPEGQPAVAIGDQEPVEALEDRLCACVVELECSHQGGAREARSHDRGLAQHSAIAGAAARRSGAPSEPRPTGERAVVRSAAHGGDHLGDEERAAVRALLRCPRRRARAVAHPRSAER